MLAAVYFQSLRENLRPSRLVPWIALGLFTLYLGTLWGGFAPQDALTDRYGNLSFLIVYRVLALAAAIVTSTILSAEVEQKTIVYLLTRPIPRWTLLVGRYLACVTVVTLVSWLGLFMASYGVFGLRGGASDILAHDMIATAAGAFAYCGLFTLFSLLFNRAMIVCLLFGFGWEASVPNMPGSVYYMSIYSHLQALAGHKVNESNRGFALLTGSLGGNTLTPQVSAIVLAAIVIVTVGASILVFSTCEFIPREDVE